MICCLYPEFIGKLQCKTVYLITLCFRKFAEQARHFFRCTHVHSRAFTDLCRLASTCADFFPFGVTIARSSFVEFSFSTTIFKGAFCTPKNTSKRTHSNYHRVGLIWPATNEIPPHPSKGNTCTFCKIFITHQQNYNHLSYMELYFHRRTILKRVATRLPDEGIRVQAA
jgi:hypothetical protein